MKNLTNTIALNHLLFSLQYWEEANLFADMNFQNVLKFKEVLEAPEASMPFIGSEISNAGLARPHKSF